MPGERNTHAPRARGGVPQTETPTLRSNAPVRMAEDQLDGRDGYELRAAKAVVIAAGGIGGNLELIRRESPPRDWEPTRRSC